MLHGGEEAEARGQKELTLQFSVRQARHIFRQGLLIKAVPHSKIRGFYVKHDDRIYQGRGILHELFGEIPL